MPKSEHSDDCPGCQPALVTPDGMMPDDHPLVVRIRHIFNNDFGIETRRAWHRVTCLNSRAEEDLRLVDDFLTAMQVACKEVPAASA